MALRKRKLKSLLEIFSETIKCTSGIRGYSRLVQFRTFSDVNHDLVLVYCSISGIRDLLKQELVRVRFKGWTLHDDYSRGGLELAMVSTGKSTDVILLGW